MFKNINLKTVAVTLVVITFFLPVSLKAQDTLIINLSSAIDSAMNNNSKILRYKQAVYEKKELKKASTGNYFPSIDLLGGYSYLSENPEVNMSKIKGSVDDIFGKYGSYIAGELGLSDDAQEVIYNKIVNGLEQLPAYNIVIDQQGYPNLNIVAKQPLFLGGKITAGRKFADAEYEYSNAEYKKITNEVTKEVIKRYYGVVLLKSVVEVRKEVVKGMKRHERDAERAIEIGVIPSHELLRAKVAVANAERDLIDDENKLDLAKLALKYSLGVPESTELVIKDSLTFKLVTYDVDNLKTITESKQPVFNMIETTHFLHAGVRIVEMGGTWQDVMPDIYKLLILFGVFSLLAAWRLKYLKNKCTSEKIRFATA